MLYIHFCNARLSERVFCCQQWNDEAVRPWLAMAFAEHLYHLLWLTPCDVIPHLWRIMGVGLPCPHQDRGMRTCKKATHYIACQKGCCIHSTGNFFLRLWHRGANGPLVPLKDSGSPSSPIPPCQKTVTIVCSRPVSPHGRIFRICFVPYFVIHFKFMYCECLWET